MAIQFVPVALSRFGECSVKHSKNSRCSTLKFQAIKLLASWLSCSTKAAKSDGIRCFCLCVFPLTGSYYILFCIAQPFLGITLRHPRWRRFFTLAREGQTRAAFTELKLLFEITMPQIALQLPGLLSKNKKMKKICVIRKSAAESHLAVKCPR